jgi:putative oxidoreductase
MSYGVLLLRVVLGLSLAAHGAQQLFGAFGGGGPRGTAAHFAGLGFRAPLLMALAAGLAEFGGGLLLAIGLLTPLAALAIAVVMLNAIATVHRRNGFWNTSGGYEYPLLVWAVAMALAAMGGARFSLDALIGWEGDLGGVWWGLAVVVGGAAISAATVLLGRSSRAPEPAAVADEPAVRRAA